MNPFTTAFIKAPKSSRFDFNHSNTFGMRFGVLTPTHTLFITPGDEVSLSMEQICRLAPMPVPTFINLKVRHDFFFVPLRLLYGSEYLDKLFGADTTIPRASVADVRSLNNAFGSFLLSTSDGGTTYSTSLTQGSPFVPGSLLDYLRYPVLTDRNLGLNSQDLADLAANDPTQFFGRTFANLTSPVNPRVQVMVQNDPMTVEPIFAYHFIWRDWYRFTGIEDNTIVEPYLNNGILSAWNVNGNPVVSFGISGDSPITSIFSGAANYVSGTAPNLSSFSHFKFAHFKKDMFMSARYGTKPTVLIPTGSNGTIPALREASAIQRFLDIISITGQRYFDKVKGVFGVESVGPKDDRVQFLARYQQYIKVGEVLTTATTSQADTGDYAGRGILIDGKYLFKRRFSEHGWLMCISSVVPDIAYSGLPRDLTDIYPLDTPIPSLAQVGDQTIFNKEVHYSYVPQANNQASFGDQFRYYAYKSANNEVHGFFLMDTAKPWSPLIQTNTPTSVLDFSKVLPRTWNYIFNDTSNEYIFGDRFFFNVDFYESVKRALPKYINYHL